MRTKIPRWFAGLLLLCAGLLLHAEDPSKLPIPTHYVNDFAQVLTPAGSARLEALCVSAQNQVDAQLFVVTVKSLDDGMSVEEFTEQLEEHWKAGKKGEDRGALLVLVLNPHKLRIETGYGLEGVLNDAKVGAILDEATPLAKTGDYEGALYTAIDGMALDLAADKGVTLAVPADSSTVHHYHYADQPVRRGVSPGQILLGIGFVLLIVVLARTGNLGWAIWLILNLMGNGGGGGGGGDDDERGGGFGGIGGGSSGGGGASRDF
jgi:uncharacterized protein